MVINHLLNGMILQVRCGAIGVCGYGWGSRFFSPSATAKFAADRKVKGPSLIALSTMVDGSEIRLL